MPTIQQILQDHFEELAASGTLSAPQQRAGWALRGTLPDEVACIHGHFLPVKYRIALARRPAHYVTWLRDPVERIASHYAFWRRDYDGSDPA